MICLDTRVLFKKYAVFKNKNFENRKLCLFVVDFVDFWNKIFWKFPKSDVFE